MATGVGTFFKFQVASTEISIPASTFKALLYSSGWIDESTVRTDQDFILNPTNSSGSVTAFELSTDGGGYDRVTLGARSFAEVDARDAVEIDISDVTFSAVSSSAGDPAGMCTFVELAANDSSAGGGRVLASFYDFASVITSNGGDITVQISTGGFLEMLASTSDASA